jgi:hypothetical protein
MSFFCNFQSDRCPGHINGNPLDCRKENLRIVTHKQNCQNIHGLNKANKSGYRNVMWSKADNCWRVSLCVDGRRISKHLHSKEEANRVAKELRRKYMPYATDY